MPDISEAEKFAFLRDGSPTANQPFQKRPGRAVIPTFCHRSFKNV
nr:MAG TPA: Protein of unknown function (DUF3208) [Inoviridae sp.]